MKRILLVLLTFWSVLSAANGAEPVTAWVERNYASLQQLYLHLHQHPELSFHEQHTAARIADEWKSAGYQVTTGVGGWGVVAVLRNGDGPTLMLRTDLDALPVTEATGLEYASTATTVMEDGTQTGVMHACGHDIHMTNLVGVARYLAENRDRWQGTLMLVGQPAEERGGGARRMLDDGLFVRFPKPDAALALHVASDLAAGKVGYRSGYTLANVDSVDITVKGRGGHGSAPEMTIDPVVQAAELIISLQTIRSREIKALEPAVISVGSIHGGTKHNIIGDECKLQLTVRSYDEGVRTHLLAAIQRKAKAVAEGHRAPPPDVVFSEGTPAVFNDVELTRKVAAVLIRVLGQEHAQEVEPVMGAEDFSLYGRAGVPIVMYRLGSVSQKRLDQLKESARVSPPLHSALYYPDVEPTLKTGIVTMAEAAIELLKKVRS